MTVYAPRNVASLPLADRLHTRVLEITGQLGWEHDALALTLWSIVDDVTSRTAAAVAPYQQGHREIHRRSALTAIGRARAALHQARGTGSTDGVPVEGALRLLDEIAGLLVR